MMKAIFNNMRTSLKPVLSVLLSAVVVYSGLMLCCQVGLTSIQPRWAKVKSCCHASTGHQLKQEPEHACTCCGFSKTVLDRANETTLSNRLTSLLDVNYVAAIDHLQPSFARTTVLASNSQGPPGLANGVPLYIQHSNLRL